MASLSVPPVLTSPRHDAIALHRAFKGFGCDSTTVINILAHRDSAQRGLIMQEYRAIYHQDLYHRLSTELSGNHKDAKLLWVLEITQHNAIMLNQAHNHDSIDLREPPPRPFSKKPSKKHTIVLYLLPRFPLCLGHDIRTQLRRDHQKLLLLRTWRRHDTEPDSSTLTYTEPAHRHGGDLLPDAVAAAIMKQVPRSERSTWLEQDVTERTYGDHLEKGVKSETSGTFELGLLTILRCAESPARYFAKALHKAMKGLGTSDTTLIRVVVTRAEVDMQYIKAEYHKKYKRSLADAIRSIHEKSGNFRTFLLLTLVGRDR
uniref:Annexin 6-1 n=1 Tax=Triticum turgidum subsp. durum TaxID=4567 RepID=A0A2H4H6G7_TRITD|nr:annexin 6-1 [Triticum turgidum subsp. durum]